MIFQIFFPLKYRYDANFFVNFSTICATIDSDCKKLICGLSNSEIRMWGIEGNIMDEQTYVNKNISRVSLTCNLEQTEESDDNIDLYVSMSILEKPSNILHQKWTP